MSYGSVLTSESVLNDGWRSPAGSVLDGRQSQFGLTRKATAFAGAALVTGTLLVLMQALIAEEFSPQDVTELDEFLINPTVAEPPLIAERTPPKPLDPVEVPPAPDRVSIPETMRPSEPVINAEAVPSLPLPRLPIAPLNPNVIDADPTPIVRVPPAMPPRADRSGHCRVGFDIAPDGRPFNVQSLACSQSLFSRPAVRSVEKWVYRPEIRDGQAVTRSGLQVTIRFVLTDDAGRIIPE